MVFNFDVRAIGRPLFYVTILATLCIKGLTQGMSTSSIMSKQQVESNLFKQRATCWPCDRQLVALLRLVVSTCCWCGSAFSA